MQTYQRTFNLLHRRKAAAIKKYNHITAQPPPAPMGLPK